MFVFKFQSIIYLFILNFNTLIVNADSSLKLLSIIKQDLGYSSPLPFVTLAFAQTLDGSM
jgi:hypothetical protein